MSSGIQTIDWPSLKSGTTIQMKDFPSVKLLKLDNTTGLYYGYSETNKLINFTSSKELNLGDIVDVKIESAKTWSLDGKAI